MTMPTASTGKAARAKTFQNPLDVMDRSQINAPANVRATAKLTTPDRDPDFIIANTPIGTTKNPIKRQIKLRSKNAIKTANGTTAAMN